MDESYKAPDRKALYKHGNNMSKLMYSKMCITCGKSYFHGLSGSISTLMHELEIMDYSIRMSWCAQVSTYTDSKKHIGVYIITRII